MSHPYVPPRRSWPQKFAEGFRGWRLGSRGQPSFYVHVPAAIAVVAVAVFLGVTPWEWCALVMCIASVLTAELFNSALEILAKAVTRSEDPHIAQALDISSGAVLLAAVGSLVVAAIIFLPRILAAWPANLTI